MRDDGTISVSLIYPVSEVVTGYGNYAARLITGLQNLESITLEKIPVRKREISFMGRPLLGTASQLLSSRIKNPAGDIVHSLTPGVINRKTNIVTLHDIVPLLNKSKYANTYYRKKGYDSIFTAILKVPILIVFTQIGKSEVVENLDISEDRIIVVPQSLDHTIFYPEEDESLKRKGRKLVVTVGDLNPRKRYDLLFKALKGREDLDVVHIGPVNAWFDNKRKLETIMEGAQNITMKGALGNDALRRYLSTADLLVHLSEGEGFGSTTVEAMACGTNVLVNNLPVFKETLNDKAFFTTLDLSDVSDSVDRALESPKSAKELIDYSKKYSIENMAKKTVETYKLALERLREAS